MFYWYGRNILENSWDDLLANLERRGNKLSYGCWETSALGLSVLILLVGDALIVISWVS